MAVLVQYLAAKASIATGRTLPQLCRDHFRRTTSTGLWAQAELVAIATDLAGVFGGLVPRLDGTESLVLAAGMLGATVMPHAIWLHGALVTDRHWESLDS